MKKKSKLNSKHKHNRKDCEKNCDLARDAALYVIEGKKVLKLALFSAVSGLHRKCYKCCKAHNFYEACIKPLQVLVQQPHDHMFPDEDDDYINNWKEPSDNWADRYIEDQKRYWNNVYNGHGIYHNSIFGY